MTAFAGLMLAVSTVFLPPQSFEAGGWALDVQFMDVMGSPYLLAHGLGCPVADATGSVTIPEAGDWHVWVRSRNWTDGAPGRFRVLVGGEPLARDFGVRQREWTWEDGGTVALKAGTVEVRLRDMTGFDGRCAGVAFVCGDGAPSDDALSCSRRPVDETLETEFCIVGAGLPGCAAALAAARSGVKTMLVQDRPHFGGNASQEVRVWSAGEGKTQPIIAEIRGHYHNMEAGTIRDDARRRSVLDRERDLTLRPCHRVFAATKNARGEIVSVRALDWKRDRIVEIRAKLFLDGTGDGWLGYYAGADWRMGREAKAEFGEKKYAPDKADADTLGASLMWGSWLAGNSDVPFAAPWAEPHAQGISALKGDWYWEYGIHRDMIAEGEAIRDRLLLAIYGSFSLAKRDPSNARYVLEFVPFILGKRESRRLMGDYVFSERDVTEKIRHDDAIAKCSWSVDLHYDDKQPGVDFLTTCRQPLYGRSYVPFRSIYSRNVPNLMMAGRCFSCTHVGLGSPRVMNTLAQMGVAAGYAAKIWKRDGLLPREIAARGKVREIQRLMGGDWPGNPDPAQASWRIVDDEDAGVVFGKGWRRVHVHNGEQQGEAVHVAAAGAEEAVYPLDVAAAGRYTVYAKVPYEPWPRETAKGDAAYEIRSGGRVSKATCPIHIGMGEWHSLGVFALEPGAKLAVVPAASTTTRLYADGFAVAPAEQDAAVAERILFPAPETVLRRTEPTSEWPGSHVDAVDWKPIDLSNYRQMEAVLSNRTDRPLEINLSVKSSAVQGRTPGGVVALAAHAVGRIVCDLDPMPWKFDTPVVLEGMNGVPGVKKGKGIFDLAKVISFHFFGARGMDPQAFDVVSVAVRADPSGRGKKMLRAATFFPFVDQFGQFMHDDWPGKVHSEAELKSAADEEAQWLVKHAEGPANGFNRYGGWAKGPRRQATGFFRTEKIDGRWWFVDPEGCLFWSFGVDCVQPGYGVTGVTKREKYFAELPARNDPDFGRFYRDVKWKSPHGFYSKPENVPYVEYDFTSANMLRKYGVDWERQSQDRAHRRLRAWGLNTIANWSDVRICRMGRTPYTLTLGTSGAPRLENSSGWWGKFPDPAHPEFERLLRARAKAAAAWMKDDPWCLGIFVDNELSWNGLGDQVVSVAERYFSTVRRVLSEELPHHLYLGCRIAWGGDDVYRIASKHCDVVSVNIYQDAPRRTLPADRTDKPLIVGEFHFGALDRGLFHTGLVATRDQDDRAAHFKAYVRVALDDPNYVGVHWFEWQDEALTGRFDGENYQIGFLTATDAPYPEMVDAAREISAEMYVRRSGR